MRRIFVHSSARASAAAASRAKKLARARDDLDRLARGLGGRFYPGEKAVTGRLRQIATSLHGPYLRYTAGTAPGGGNSEVTSAAERAGGAPGLPGKPALTWWLDQDTIDAEAATDGWYALLTSLDASIAATEVLLRYKGQEAVERRYGNLKGPLAVAPMILNSNRRIAALITVISLALLIFCLIEREARRSLAPQTRIDGLYNRQPARPTAGSSSPPWPACN